MTLYEMEGFLRGKCLPGDMMVNETNAEYLVRKFSELQSQNAELAVQLANAESKCRVLAAENAGLKDSVEHAAGCIHAAEVEGLIDALGEKDGERLADLVHRRLCHAYLPVETPATDAFLAEVRAQGVEMFALQQRQIAAEQDRSGDYEFSRHCSISATEACEFAEELREGKCCEVQS